MYICWKATTSSPQQHVCKYIRRYLPTISPLEFQLNATSWQLFGANKIEAESSLISTSFDFLCLCLWIDSIAISVFVVILDDFDKYWDGCGIWNEQACLSLEPKISASFGAKKIEIKFDVNKWQDLQQIKHVVAPLQVHKTFMHMNVITIIHSTPPPPQPPPPQNLGAHKIWWTALGDWCTQNLGANKILVQTKPIIPHDLLFSWDSTAFADDDDAGGEDSDVLMVILIS